MRLSVKVLEEIREELQKINFSMVMKNVSLNKLRPEFIKEIKETIKNGKLVKVKDFAEVYKLK